MHEKTLSIVMMLCACVPTDIIEADDVGGTDTAGTDTSALDDETPAEAFAKVIYTLTYELTGPSRIVILAFAKDETAVAEIVFAVEENAVDPRLIISAELLGVNATWMLDDGEVVANAWPQDGPIIGARAQVIADMISDDNDELASCVMQIAEAVADCAPASSDSLDSLCADAFTLSYCECRAWLFEFVNIPCT